MQPPPPPPPPSSPQSPSFSGPGNCQWCSQPMSADAVRCNSCGKIRKSIYNEKVICYIFCGIGGLLIGIGAALWKKTSRAQYGDYIFESPANNTTSYVLLGIGIAAAIVGIYYYVRVSQKLKNWVWR